MKGAPFGTNPTPLLEDGIGMGLEPVVGEFQPPCETGYSGGGAHLIFDLHSIFVLNVRIHLGGDNR
jgi:hypothetical protein